MKKDEIELSRIIKERLRELCEENELDDAIGHKCSTCGAEFLEEKYLKSHLCSKTAGPSKLFNKWTKHYSIMLLFRCFKSPFAWNQVLLLETRIVEKLKLESHNFFQAYQDISSEIFTAIGIYPKITLKYKFYVTTYRRSSFSDNSG